MDERDAVNWLFLDLNSYFASVEQQERPELRDRPVGVVPLFADTTSLIAASYEAKAFGCKTGTKVAEAKALCPGIRLVQARHAIYVRYHHAIVDAVDSCVPVDAVASIDEMVCRLTGSQRDPENARTLALHVKKTIHQKIGPYLKSSIGLAPSRFLGKVASDMQKPDGLTVIRKRDLPQCLYPLSLRDLPGVGPRMEKRLRDQGIGTIELLCRLSARDMAELWGGVWGERMFAWLAGDNVMLAPTRHQSLSHSHVLSPEMRTYPEAYKVAKKLTSKLALRLRKEKYWTSGMTLQIKPLGNGESWQVRKRLPDVQDTPSFLKALDDMWKGHPAAAPLLVGVVFHPLIETDHHIPSLFENPKKERLAHAMDLINSKHGGEAAYYASLFDTKEKAPTHIAFNRIPELSEFE